MELIQLLLPLYDNEGRAFGPELYSAVRSELAERFGGLTAYVRAPAHGIWTSEAGAVRRDDVVIFEVMTDRLDEPWWRQYRRGLENRFRQETLVVRALGCRLL